MIGVEWIPIKPMSFGPEQRVEAVAIATAKGNGVRMEVHTAHTEFYADPSVPVGQVAVYIAKRYGSWPTFEVLLDDPEQEWVPRAWRIGES